MKRAIGFLVALATLAPRAPASAEGMAAARMWMRMCAKPTTWERVKRCYGDEQGRLDIVRRSGDATIVRVERGGMPMSGLYVFESHGRSVTLAGSFATTGWGDVTLLGTKKVRVGGTHAIRLDIGSVMPSAVALDGQTAVPALATRKLVVFCLGAGRCTLLVESCDILVDGKAYYTFHGKVQLRGATAVVDGDRSRAGDCQPTTEAALLGGGIL